MRDTQYTITDPYESHYFGRRLWERMREGPSLGSAMRASASIIVARVKLMRAFTRRECAKRILHLGIIARNSTDLLGRQPSLASDLWDKRGSVFGNSCPPSPFPSRFTHVFSFSLSLRITSNADVPSSLTFL